MNTNTFKLVALEDLVGHRFRDPDVLREALTHASLKRSSWNLYERLEFLGDRVLGLVISESLLKKGIYVISFSYPVVPKDQARIRVQISASHSKTDLNIALEGFAESGRELKIIK